MGHKVDISEVIEFSSDFSTASEDLKSQLKKVENNIEKLQSMDGFSGEAAQSAKNHFGELHITILKSFEHLLTDLDERLDSHLRSFSSQVDGSESAIIYNGYLSETEEEITETYELFSEEQDTIRDTIGDVSDISSATQPKSMLWDSDYKDAAEVLSELQENLQSYTEKEIDDASEIEELQQQIETTIKESGEVTEDNHFKYLKDKKTPDSLHGLQKYNQGKNKEMLDEAEEAKNESITNMDEDSQQIASKAFEDLSDGTIDEDEYYAYLEELNKLNNEQDQEEEVSSNFIDYVIDNKGDVSNAFKSNAMAGMIEYQAITKSNDAITRADLIKEMNAGKPGAGSYMKEQGKEILKAGRYVGGAFNAATIGYGTYDDYMNTDKTLGEAGTKNITDGALSGLAFSGGYAAIAATAGAVGAATPVGLAVITGVVAGTVATTGFNYMYDNNKLGFQTGVDWVGDKVDKAGEAVSGFFSNATSWVTG